jgi:hypothetical protein
MVSEIGVNCPPYMLGDDEPGLFGEALECGDLFSASEKVRFFIT